jgi:dUTP pyrophosphatase
MTEKVRIEVLKRNKSAIVPHKNLTTDAGLDVHSMEDAVINPGDVVDIDTGMACTAPIGYYFTVEGRSSLYKRGVTPFRGILDATYTGNVTISLMNVGKESYKICKGDRIAQLILHKVVECDMIEVTEISPAYNVRGSRGFGSSGK